MPLKFQGGFDFGDVRRSCLISELVNNEASFRDKNNVVIDRQWSSYYLVPGYFPLAIIEFELSYDMISMRFCEVYLITSTEAKRCPENEYLRTFDRM